VNVITKDATVTTVESENPNGEFEVVLSTETLDRDAENLWAGEWKQPLPARIHIDGDHGRSLEKTVGSAVPRIEGNRMIGKGTFAGTDYAQMVRQLVNEGHVNSVSVTYSEHKNQKDGGVQRELLNAAFVAIPANPEAVVLTSKSAQTGNTDGVTPSSYLKWLNEQKAAGTQANPTVQDLIQAIHDAAVHLGSMCDGSEVTDTGTGADDGANKSIETSDVIVGSPQESPDGDPAEVATKAAADQAPAEVPTDAAEPSAEHSAARLKARAFLIRKSLERLANAE
jgi:hypothetical protein